MQQKLNHPFTVQIVFDSFQKKNATQYFINRISGI